MPRLIETIIVDRPIDEVWTFLNDIFNPPRLRGSALGARQTSPGPMRAGTTFVMNAMILGFETRLEGAITDWDPPRLAAGSLAGRPFRAFVLREELESTAQGTRVVRSVDMELRPAFKLVWPFVAPLIRRSYRRANRNIKTLIEASPRADESAPLVSAGTAALAGLQVRRTIMFTDIVGSTALIAAIGDAAWRDLRRWHDATVRRLVAEHRGDELDHAGDGFCIAFASAADGVDCAVALQRTLTQHRRTAGFAPAIRIGLHAGSVEPDGASLTGVAVHTAARIAAAAGGGEILATDEVIREARVTPASEPRVMELAGISQPTSVVSIAW
jgi:class 3 adenylate cyclase